MVLFLPVYQIDFQLKEIRYLRLNFLSSENFPANELDIISQFITVKNEDVPGCKFDFRPRQIKITYINQEWLQFTNPYRGGTQEYLDLLEDIRNSNQFSNYEVIPERIPWRFIFNRYRYG